jgi:phosphatidylglycerophosphate synthase
MNRFIVKTLIVSVLCATIGNLLPFFSEMANQPIWFLTIVIYVLLTILLRAWVAKSQKGSAIKFSTAVIGTTTAKMLLTLVIITTYLVSKWPNRELFVFGVFGVFVAFSVLFVIDIQRLIKEG